MWHRKDRPIPSVLEDNRQQKEPRIHTVLLFNKESKDFYLSSNKNTYNDIVGLQEGFGLYIE